MKRAAIQAIEYHLPEFVLTNGQLAREFPDWSAEKIEAKTGIRERRIAADNECASDLGVTAARKLFASGACRAGEIDHLLLCTQSPDYFLPATACVMQKRLGLRTSVGALDFNQGCSGFVYGLGIAKGLIETGQAGNILLITAETYSKFIHPEDKSVRTIFGDAAAATLVSSVETEETDARWLGPFVFGTDGSGAENLMVPNGAMRNRHAAGGDSQFVRDENGNARTADNLYMNGGEIFNFTIRTVPQCLAQLLSRAALHIEEVDLFVFHQANQYMLDHLRKKLRIPEEKFVLALRDTGNTVSSTIPIALRRAWDAGKLPAGSSVVLIGFGVGYSWAATLVRWLPSFGTTECATEAEAAFVAS